MTARTALEMATRGGAKNLGREDIGQLAPKMAGDFVAYDLNQIEWAGTQADPLAALVFCQPTPVNYSVIHGKIVIAEGTFIALELPMILEQHHRISTQLINGTL